MIERFAGKPPPRALVQRPHAPTGRHGPDPRAVAVLGKIVGVACEVRSENSSDVPFIVLVASGYLMVIGGGLAGGSFAF